MRHTVTMLGLVSVLALSACGGDGEDGRFERFIGTWRSTSGTITEVCPGYGTFTDPFSGNVTWGPGISSDLVVTDPATGCVTLAEVTGSTATGLPGQTCTASDGIGGVSTLSLTGYTFVISPDGRTATENASGAVTYIAQGATVVCSVNATGSYQKISN